MAFWTVKGGAGKTTLTALIGASLARAGRKILLVDLDPQASLSEAVGMPRAGERATSFQLFQAPASPEEINRIIQRVDGVARCSIIGAGLELLTSQQRGADDGETRAFHENLELLRAQFDYVIFDCRPGLDWITQNALQHCDHILTPLLPNEISISAAELAKKIMHERVQRSYKVPITAIFNQTNSHADRPKFELDKGNFEIDFRPLRRTVPRSVALARPSEMIRRLGKKKPTTEESNFLELLAEISRDVERRTAASVRSKVRAADLQKVADQERASLERMTVMGQENKRLRETLLQTQAEVARLSERLRALDGTDDEEEYYRQIDEGMEEQERASRIEALEFELRALKEGKDTAR